MCHIDNATVCYSEVRIQARHESGNPQTATDAIDFARDLDSGTTEVIDNSRSIIIGKLMVVAMVNIF